MQIQDLPRTHQHLNSTSTWNLDWLAEVGALVLEICRPEAMVPRSCLGSWKGLGVKSPGIPPEEPQDTTLWLGVVRGH